MRSKDEIWEHFGTGLLEEMSQSQSTAIAWLVPSLLLQHQVDCGITGRSARNVLEQ
jgi:hypothetical protein